MDKNQIFELMSDAFKSLTVSNIEIVLLSKPYLKVRVIAEKYANQSIPERIITLNNLIYQKNSKIFDRYIISFDPLTPAEFSEFFENDDNSNKSTSDTSFSKVSKEADT